MQVTDKMAESAARILNKRLTEGNLYGVSRDMLEAALAAAPAVAVKAEPQRPELGEMPPYGRARFTDLMAAVTEAIFGDRDFSKLDLDHECFIGHQMVQQINFNSLNRIVSAFASPVAQATDVPQIAVTYEPGSWFKAKSVDEMQAFYLSRLPAIREAAREHGYAIGTHGSQRRDFDLIAMQWRDGASDKDILAHAIAEAACGISRDGPYDWEQKPAGRVATSLPICWTAWHDMISAGHIDLSLTDAAPTPKAEGGQ